MASGGSSAAPDSVGASDPRQLSIHVPPWIFLLPIAALGLYYVLADGPRLESPLAAIPTTQAEPRLNRAAVSADIRAVDEPRAAAAASAEDFRPRADAPPTVITPQRPPAHVPEAPDPRAQAARASEVMLAREQAEVRELAAARQEVDVIVYFTEWCPACRSVRGYLAERGIRSVEHDVEKDRRASLRQRQLNPRGSVPTIDIEGQVLVGFSAKRIEQAIDRAARSRIARLQSGM